MDRARLNARIRELDDLSRSRALLAHESRELEVLIRAEGIYDRMRTARQLGRPSQSTTLAGGA
ncbi:MAG TPA: hypothetical protein VGB54_11070 [Allosphingosinicella sp.]|jgi:hypothetical protein